MKEIIETSKGRFVVVDIPIDVVFVSQEGFVRFEDDVEYTPLISEKAQHTLKLSEITEEEASSIVDNSIMNELFYKNYINEGYNGRTWLHSAIQSLHSLLKSQVIEITNNTYIFKV